MALGFTTAKGSAIKSKMDSFTPAEGENRVRMVGGLLPRYVYWLKGTNDKNLQLECLAFNRDLEKFDNVEQDWIPEFYPDVKCSWAYVVQIIDPKDGKLKVWNLKKNLTGEIITAAEDLGDPTDPETGWDVVFEKKKTGPKPINVSYTLKVLRCKPRPLTSEERAVLDTMKNIEEVFPRPTPEAQKTFLEKIKNGGGESSSENIDETIADEFTVV